MYRIIYFSFISILSFLFFVFPVRATEEGAHLRLPVKSLFSHPRHNKVLNSLNIQCSECHNFSIKSSIKGPLAPSVDEGYLKPFKGVCHQCHFGKVSVPRPQQCSMCHLGADKLKPKDHFLNWKERHGRMAQVDKTSCTKCHNTPQTCDQCHFKFDRMSPRVHPANFRYFHSVQVRSSPQSCVICHRKGSFCQDCHFGKRR